MRIRHLLLRMPGVLLMVATLSCGEGAIDPGRNPSTQNGLWPPFSRVVAIGNLSPDDAPLFVIDHGDSFVTLEDGRWSRPRHISEIFAGPCPFETIGAIGSYLSPHVVFSGDGTRYADPRDPSGRSYDTTVLGAGVPVGAVGLVGETIYYFEHGGTRVRSYSRTGVIDGHTERPIDAVGEVRGHMVEVSRDGTRFDSYIWNPPDIRHAESHDQHVFELSGIPAVWRVSYLRFSVDAPCDADGLGEFDAAAEVSIDGRTIARVGRRTIYDRIQLWHRSIYTEVPARGPVSLEVLFRCSELDFLGPDPRMDARVASATHVLEVDGTASNTPDGARAIGVLKLNGSADCATSVRYTLDRAP